MSTPSRSALPYLFADRPIQVDLKASGPLLAALDADDRYHAACVALLGQTSETLVVPAPVLVELDYWIRKRLDLTVWRTFAEDVERGAYRLRAILSSELARVAELESRSSTTHPD